MTIDTMMTIIRAMPVDERKRLISLIVDSLTEAEGSSAGQPHRLLDYEGAGAELWAGVDVQAYLNGLRDEWDRRS